MLESDYSSTLTISKNNTKILWVAIKLSMTTYASMYPVFSFNCCLGLVLPDPQIAELLETLMQTSLLKLGFGSCGVTKTAIHLPGMFWHTLHLAEGTRVVLAMSWTMNWPNCIRRELKSWVRTALEVERMALLASRGLGRVTRREAENGRLW